MFCPSVFTQMSVASSLVIRLVASGANLEKSRLNCSTSNWALFVSFVSRPLRVVADDSRKVFRPRATSQRHRATIRGVLFMVKNGKEIRPITYWEMKVKGLFGKYNYQIHLKHSLNISFIISIAWIQRVFHIYNCAAELRRIQNTVLMQWV